MSKKLKITVLNYYHNKKWEYSAPNHLERIMIIVVFQFSIRRQLAINQHSPDMDYTYVVMLNGIKF